MSSTNISPYQNRGHYQLLQQAVSWQASRFSLFQVPNLSRRHPRRVGMRALRMSSCASLGFPRRTSISRDMGSATSRSVDRKLQRIWIPRSKMHNRPLKEFAKTYKIDKKRKWPLWPWLWPCDLEVIRVCWPCLYLPMIWIWWRSVVIKAVKSQFQCLTLDINYLTLRTKIQNSAALRFCVLPLRTYLCVFNTLQSKL